MPLQLQVSANQRQLETTDGKAFFWLADTAWELLHRWTPKEITHYLNTRATQGFNVIQVVLLAELDGLRVPNRLGMLPLLNQDPDQPNPAYFDFAEQVLRQAAALGLYVALLPAWADKVLPRSPGLGPVVFGLDRLEVAQRYGRFLGQRFRQHPNLIWVLGGDREVMAEDLDYRPVWRAMAAGIRAGGANQLISFHPDGGPKTPSQVANESWLDVVMFQSGHWERESLVWDWLEALQQHTHKPMLDGEICYEDHGVFPWKPDWPQNDYFGELEVRRQAYRSVFAGGCGVSYGHHSVWQAYNPELYKPEWYPRMGWCEALVRPAAWQMVHLRRLMESRPILPLPNQSLIAHNGYRAEHMRAWQAADQSCAMVYVPQAGWKLEVQLEAKTHRAWWFEPRSGGASLIGQVEGGSMSFTSPIHGPDWVLVLDDLEAGYGVPGC